MWIQKKHMRVKSILTALLIVLIFVLVACEEQTTVPLDTRVPSLPIQPAPSPTVPPSVITATPVPSFAATPIPIPSVAPSVITATPVPSFAATPIPIPSVPSHTPTPPPVIDVEGWTDLSNVAWIELKYPLMAADIKATHWVADGITTEFEHAGAQSLIDMVIWAGINRIALNHILGSPFLVDVKPPDTWALNELRFFAENEKPYFAELYSHLLVQDGITDDAAKLIGVLYVLDYDRDLRPLASDTFMVERVVNLPVSGTTYLTVVRVGNLPTVATLDRLTAAVRAIDSFLQVPLPDNILLAVSDKAYSDSGIPYDNEDYTGLNSGGQMVILEIVDTKEDSNWGAAGVIFHETAHYIFKNGPTWIVEGFSEGTEELLKSQGTGQPLDLNHPELSACPGIETFEQLEAAHLKVNSDAWAIVSEAGNTLNYCEQQFGARLFVRLYMELGPDQFRRGVQKLYSKTVAFSGEEPPTIADVINAFGPESAAILAGKLE